MFGVSAGGGKAAIAAFAAPAAKASVLMLTAALRLRTGIAMIRAAPRERPPPDSKNKNGIAMPAARRRARAHSAREHTSRLFAAAVACVAARHRCC